MANRKQMTRQRAKLLRVQQFINQQCRSYRTGLPPRGYYSQDPVPFVTSHNPLDDEFAVPRPRHRYDGHAIKRRHPRETLGALGPPHRLEVRQIRVRLQRIARRAFDVGVRFRRVLACGGMGVAALFEVQNEQGRWNKCVVKVARLYGEMALYVEEAVMKSLRGAPHIVQHKTVRELRRTPGGYASEAVDGRLPDEPPRRPLVRAMQALDANPMVLIMEYARMGTLAHWLATANADADGRRDPLDTETLWHLLACLVRGCLALQYPPGAKYRPRAVAPETVPPPALAHRWQQRGRPYNHVHFDLDPGNILVAGFDETEHRRVPRLQIADMGLVRTADDAFLHHGRPLPLWNCRTIGKTGHMAPEQWTAEWDGIAFHPAREGAQIAGRYGAATNIWQLGLVMQSCLTGWHPEHPPCAQRVSFLDPTDGRAQRRDLLTHGWVLAGPRFAHCDPDLCAVVMACLAHRPDDRPTLARLLATCDARLQAGFDSDQTEPSWARRFFSAANLPPEPTPQEAFRRGSSSSSSSSEEEEESSEESESSGGGPPPMPPLLPDSSSGSSGLRFRFRRSRKPVIKIVRRNA